MKFKKIDTKKLLVISMVSVAVGVGLYFGGYQFLVNVFSTTAGQGAVSEDDGKYNLSEFKDPNQCGRLNPWGPPEIKDAAINSRSLFICRNKYAVQYDTKIKVPLWETEIINKRDFAAFNIPSSFVPSIDPEVPKKMQPALTDYSSIGYAFGFQAAIENAYIKSPGTSVEQLEEMNRKSLQESLYLTNAIPETPAANIIRKQIDNYFRQLAVNPLYEDMFVLSGPVFLNGNTKGLVGEGEDKMAIPTHFYKILTNPATYGSIAYLVPNEKVLPCAQAPCSMQDYVVSIKEVERVTGIEFFSSLDSYYAMQVRQDPNEFLRKKN